MGYLDRQVNTKNGTAADEFIKEWMSVTNFAHKNRIYILFQKMRF
jgi:hypothetical protein